MALSDVHEIKLPMKVIVGSQAVVKVVEVLRDISSQRIRIGIVTGESTYRAGGRLVEELLGESADITTWIVRESVLQTAKEISSKVAESKVKVLLGVGGGKPIDIAKYAGHSAGVPVISVPLSPSHDGIASPFSSIRGTERSYSMYTAVPYAVVADIDLISRAPKRLILSGLGDLLGKLVSVKDWALAHRLRGEYYGEYAAQLALLSAKHVMKYHELIASATPEGIRVLVEALISSGVSMCIAGSSRPASGSEHLFAHALELLAPGKVLHGEAVALGTVAMLYVYGDPLWAKVKEIVRKVGLPSTAKELNVPGETLVKALTIAHTIRPERYTILGEKGLSREAALRVLEGTGIL